MRGEDPFTVKSLLGVPLICLGFLALWLIAPQVFWVWALLGLG